MKEMLSSASLKTKYVFVLLAALFFVLIIAYAIYMYPDPIANSGYIFKMLIFIEMLTILLFTNGIYKLTRNSSNYIGISGIIKDEIFDDNSIFSTLSDGIIVADKKGRIRSVNQGLYDILGLEEKQLINKNLYSLVGELEYNDEYKFLPLIMIESLEAQKEFSRKEKVLVINAELHYLEVSTHLLRNKSKNVAGVFTVVHDFTQNKKLEQQLLRIEKLATASQMAAELAHEIKNPICSIKGLIQIMGKKHCLENSKYYEVITSEIERISVLIQSFLTLSQKRPLFEQVSIDKVFKGIMPLIGSNAEIKNINISIDMQKEVPLINADSENIKQVIVNIVQNAIDALHDGGRISISIWYDQINESIKIEFKDNGNGIKKEHLDKIFEPFFTTKDNGTGLGLAISRKIIESHCGKLFAFNNLDGGATFVIELPAANNYLAVPEKCAVGNTY